MCSLNKNKIIRITLLGECCFSLESGDVVGIYKFLNQEKFNNALDMIFSVARDMGIITLMRKVESTSPKHDNESNYTYDYEIVMEVKINLLKCRVLNYFLKF